MPHAPGVEHGRTQFSVWGMLISKTSRNKEAAWKFIEFVTNKENQLRAAIDYANGAVRTSVYENSEYLALYPPAKGWMLSLAVSADLPAHEELPYIEDQLIVGLHRALQGQSTPQQALNAVCAQVRTVL